MIRNIQLQLGVNIILILNLRLFLPHLPWPGLHPCSVHAHRMEKRDVNDVYGTYARGWDGEGEYGDGDKVYVSDNNENYSSDYSAGAETSRTTDNNPCYGH